MFTTLSTSAKIKNTAIITLAGLLIMTAPVDLKAQAVTEVITDYNGYWKTSSTAVSPVKPDNSHNLLSFGYNGTRYSTGVNDASLTAHGENFVPGVFHALPLQNFNGTVNSSTKIGKGAMADGVANGTAGAAPSRNLGTYLNDGSNGLDLGTCVANMPAGSMFLSVSNLQAALIGDGVPDILVTQVADPSSKYDRYEFTDVNGVRVGNTLDIVLNNITPVGNWTADFFEATGSTVLTSGFTQTQRPIRLWAADLSSFGINAENIKKIAYFKIVLSGDTDIAFVAYNTTSISMQVMLDLPAEIAAKENNGRAVAAAAAKSFSIYPNPATLVVNINHAIARASETISVYNMQGVLLVQTPVERSSIVTKLNINTLRKGSYQIVYTENQLAVSSSLLIVQ